MSVFNKKFNFSSAIVVLLLFFFIDEFVFVLYNISFFQYMCSNTLSLFLTDEIPLWTVKMNDSIYLLISWKENSSFCINTNLNFLLSSDGSFNSIVTSSFTNELPSLILKHDIDLNTFYKIKMEATNVKKHLLSFYPLQTYIYTIPGESTLIFYRLENLTNFSMHSLSVYVTSPAEAVAYIKKLQCFCYEELMISPKCIIDLPILFSIDEEILKEDLNEITINYILLLKEKL